MAEQGEGRVHGVQQPKIGDIGGGEIGQALIFLTPQSRDGARACRQNLHQLARDSGQVIAGVKIQ